MTPMLCVHFAATWMLVGLIWVVQILAYPQFLRVNETEFAKYHFAHCLRIGFLISPLLAVEAFTAALLLYQGFRSWPFLISAGLILLIWLCTAAIQAPLHMRLMKGADLAIVRRLIWSNWLRTLAWTARGVLVGYVVLA